MNNHANTRPLDATAFELPNDPTLEAAVLGALLLEKQYIADVRGVIAPATFYDATNAKIFGIICRLDDKGSSPDLVSVVQEAKTEGIAPAYVARLTQAVGSGVEVVNHARRLADLEMQRRLILFSSELAARAQAGSDAAEWASKQLDEITGTARVNTGRKIGDVLSDTLEAIERRAAAAGSGQAVGITTGIPTLDRVTGGWRGGQLVVLAGRAAMGKTAVSLSFVRAAAAAGTPVCCFSLEMDDASLVQRMLVGVSGVDAGNVRTGRLTSDDWRNLERGADDLRELPVYLFDEASTSMAAIRAQCRAMRRKGRCGMVVIDYLQLMGPDSDRRGTTREQQVAGMSREAKLLAKQLDVPVLLLSQLSRKVEERADKTPMLSDLRESGAIEQDADLVIFIHRPAYYDEGTIDDDRFGVIPSAGVGILTIAKNREGATCRVFVRHNESLTRITDYADETDATDSPY